MKTVAQQGLFRAVIFDLDGLMLDTERIAADAWVRAGSDFGYPISETLVREIIGRTGADSDGILRRVLGPEFPLEDLKERRLMYTDTHIREIGVPRKPGLTELLEFLERKQMKKAVATSSTYDRAIMKLRRAELQERFTIVVSGDDVQHGKPAPDIYQLAAERLNVLPEQCLALEDSDAGVRAAHAAGMSVIIIPDINAPAADVVPLAYRIERSLTDVLHFLPEVI